MLELVLLLPFPITNQEVGSILGRTVPGSAGIRVRLQLQLATPGDSSSTNLASTSSQVLLSQAGQPRSRIGACP